PCKVWTERGSLVHSQAHVTPKITSSSDNREIFGAGSSLANRTIRRQSQLYHTKHPQKAQVMGRCFELTGFHFGDTTASNGALLA
ncbi:hypothetical protein, partial [Desulforhopalus singaporensis]